MGNRIIKESICTSSTIDKLSWFGEVLFYRLIVNADDYGRFDGRPAVIKGRLFPLKDIRIEQIEAGLNELSSVGIVARYSVSNGQSFLQIVTWAKHQQIRNKKSKYPDPEKPLNLPVDKSSDIACNRLISNDSVCVSNPIQSNPKDSDRDIPLSSGSCNSNTGANQSSEEALEGHKYFEKNISPCYGKNFEILADLVAQFGLEKFKEAVDMTKKSGGRTIKYVDAVLHFKRKDGKAKKNDAREGFAKAKELLESGGANGIF